VIVVVLGGIRSGKSDLGEQIARRLGEPVTVVVPARPEDPDFASRVRVHQARRPPSWATLECGPDLPAALTSVRGTALVDSLGSWVAAAPDFGADPTPLLDAVRRRDASTVFVSEEVGLSVHPPTELGRRFADTLGALNTAVAAIADRVLLCVAGRVVPLDTAVGALDGP
jgi:adenosyl cobinamide kinase/adenosyl cobinamide phosphate guanylyltransferase